MNYLIETDSKVLLDEELKKIVKNSMNKVIYQFSDVKIKDILEEASYVSMFSDTKYLIVKNADFFGKGKLTDEESKLLQSYLNHPYEMTVLIFTTYEPIDKRKKIVKEFNGKVISLKSFSGFDLVNATKKLVLSKGYHISDDGIRYLISACLNNWDLINSEVNKLGLIFKKDDKITNDVLRDIVSQNISDNQFKFVDAVIRKDYVMAFKLLNDLKVIKTEVLVLVHLLIREFKLMIMVSLMEGKMSRDDILKELSLASWQYQKVYNNKNKYHIEDLKENLLILIKLDYQIKCGEVDKWLALENYLLSFFEY